MILRKGFSALIAAAALGMAAQSASALAVQLTVDGCNNGQSIHATVTFNCNTGFISIDSKGKTKKGTELCGGIIFAACNPSPDLTPPPPPEDHHGDTGTHTGQDGPPTHDWTDNDPDCHDNFNGDSDPGTDIHWKGPDSCITGPEGIPQLSVVSGDVPATPLPASVWGASGLIASLGIVRGLRRKLA